jgi:hypothetical protein
VINGNTNRSSDKILELYDLAIDKIEIKDQTIVQLQTTIDSLNVLLQTNKDIISTEAFINLSKDAKIKFLDLEYFGFAKMLTSSDFKTSDTLQLATVEWNSMLSDSLVNLKNQELKQWLEDELETNKVEVIKH